MKTALTIAGSDSSGGAGIQADMKTMTANGVYAMSAVTALTAQNTTGVTDILESTPHFLGEQLDAIFTDIFPDAAKIGMVSSADLIVVIAEKLKQYKAENIVVDPVMVATSGAKLLRDDAVEALCRELDVPFTLLHSEIHHIIFDLRKEKNPCSMCAKMRRGALHNALREHGITKIALGHHFDDAVETFFLSLFYEGRLSCFQPVTYLDRTGITQIRPLLYCGEGMLRNAAERNHLPVVFNPCPADGNTKRQEVKELIKSLDKQYPGLKSRVFGAMQGLPLPAWGPVEHRRVPLPEGD